MGLFTVAESLERICLMANPSFELVSTGLDPTGSRL